MTDADIHLTVRMNGTLRRFNAGQADMSQLVMPARSRVEDALEALGAAEEVWLVAVNREVVPRDHPLNDGDSIECYEQLEGG